MKILFKGAPVNTAGDLPAIGDKAPDFTLTDGDLNDVKLGQFKGKRVILNIFISLDTSTCATSVRKFNEEAAKLDNTVVFCISKDLPFAQTRFCGAEGIENVVTLSEFRDRNFSDAYKVDFTDSALKGLLSRVVLVLDEEHRVVYREQVAEASQEPDYKSAIEALKLGTPV